MAQLVEIRKHYAYALQDKKKLLEEITLPGQQAADVLTFVGQPANAQTVTIDGKVYTFQTVLTDVDGHVLIGAVLADSIANLVAAINLGAGAGTAYAASTVAHPTVTASLGVGSSLQATAQLGGPSGNSIAVSTTVGGASWATPTLTGGSALTDDVRDKAILGGVQWYNRILPRLNTVLVVATSNGIYNVPSDWSDEISRIVAIRNPADSVPPSYVSLRGLQIIAQPDGTPSQFYITPNPAPSFLLTYLARHGANLANPSETLVGSIPQEHEGPVGRMSAALAADEMADFYGQTTRNNVDSVDYRSKADEWRALSKNLRQQVERELRAAELSFAKNSDQRTYFRGWM